METELLVGPQLNADGNTPQTARGGSYGEALTGDMNGFFAEQTMRGNGYAFSTALAGNALVAPTTSNAPAIWNPPQSGKILILQKIAFNRTAVGTPLEGGIVYCFFNAFAGPGTGASIVSATWVAAQNLRSDLGDNSGMKFAPTTISMTGGPSYVVNSGISQAASTGTTTGVASFPLVDWLYGSIVLMPGWMFALAAQVSLSTTYGITIYGISLPKPQLSI